VIKHYPSNYHNFGLDLWWGISTIISSVRMPANLKGLKLIEVKTMQLKSYK